MEANLVSVLQWQKPIKSAVAFVSLNIIFWMLNGQRPLFVLSLCFLIAVLRSCWKRVRGVVLVDPPDHESWTPLETYDMKYTIIELSKSALRQYLHLRSRSHVAFSIVSCCLFLGIGKLGTFIHLRTIIFLLANGAFCVGPLMKMIQTAKKIPDELVPDIDTPGSPTLWSPTDSSEEHSRQSAPDSLTAFTVDRMRGHDEESDDEFHFEFHAKHFDSSRSSTSSATSTSFELVNI